VPDNAFAFPDRCGAAWRNAGVIRAIGAFLLMVFQEPKWRFGRLPFQQFNRRDCVEGPYTERRPPRRRFSLGAIVLKGT
jgi:hypothetical protein